MLVRYYLRFLPDSWPKYRTVWFNTGNLATLSLANVQKTAKKFEIVIDPKYNPKPNSKLTLNPKVTLNSKPIPNYSINHIDFGSLNSIGLAVF